MFVEILKAIFFGIVEGVTEWLPISSTGHLILVQEFVKLNQEKSFMEMFNIVIQLGAILAVIVLYFERLNPFQPGKTKQEVRLTWQLWLKVAIAMTGLSVKADNYLRIGMEAAYAPFNWTQNDDSNGAVPIEGTNQYANGYDVKLPKKLQKPWARNPWLSKLLGQA